MAERKKLEEEEKQKKKEEAKKAKEEEIRKKEEEKLEKERAEKERLEKQKKRMQGFFGRKGSKIFLLKLIKIDQKKQIISILFNIVKKIKTLKKFLTIEKSKKLD